MSEQSLADTVDPDEPTAPDPEAASIVDTILDLDELLSADVRRAEGIYRIFLRPDLEAEIEALQEQLEAYTDEMGRATQMAEQSLGDTGIAGLAEQIEQRRAESWRQSRIIRLRQLDGDAWEEFQGRWKKELNSGGVLPQKFWHELIAATAYEPVISQTQLIKMRQVCGATQIDRLGQKCWKVNTEAGVSVPKSSLSSLVLRRQELEQS